MLGQRTRRTGRHIFLKGIRRGDFDCYRPFKVPIDRLAGKTHRAELACLPRWCVQNVQILCVSYARRVLVRGIQAKRQPMPVAGRLASVRAGRTTRSSVLVPAHLSIRGGRPYFLSFLWRLS